MKRQRHSDVEELIRIATEGTEKDSAVPKPTPREERQRRPHRLIPDLPPLTPASQWANDPLNPKTQY
jgi:hypothetical protein